MDYLGNIKLFTSLDLHSGYWKYHIAEENILITAFFTRYRLYKWMVMLMGLTNVAAMFMQMMNNLFMDILDKGIVVFPI